MRIQRAVRGHLSFFMRTATTKCSSSGWRRQGTAGWPVAPVAVSSRLASSSRRAWPLVLSCLFLSWRSSFLFFLFVERFSLSLSLSLSSLDDVNSTVVLREWATFSHVLLGWCSATHPSRKINIPRTLFYGKKVLNVPETTKIVLRFEFESHENIFVLWEG